VISRSRRERFLEFVGDSSNVKRILVVRNGLVGDTVFVTPVLKRLRENFPNSELDFATSAKSLPLLKNYPYVDAIYPIPAEYSTRKHSRFFFALRKHRYDLVIVQEVNSHYVVMAKLTMARFLAGFKNSLGFLLDYSVLRPRGVHAVLAELETVRGWTRSSPSNCPELPITTVELNEAREILMANRVSDSDSIVCIHPGCSGTGAEREWLPRYYSELADLLIETKTLKVIFTGVEQDRKLVEGIRVSMRNSSESLVGKTSIRQLLGILKFSKVAIGPDTGTLHLANAVGTPVVMLSGPNDPVDTGPFDVYGRSQSVRVDMPCIGCVHRDPKPAQWEICKNIRPVLCMEKLSPEMVFNAVGEVLNMKAKAN
jgi:lipopolysaccharide heptosyltransferase II